MSIKKKIKDSMESYVSCSLLPSAYAVYCAFKDKEMISYDEFISKVLDDMKGGASAC